ncbi:hypothetical protein EM858_04180 [Agrobacterium sp. CNPSo 2736]|uniref:ORF6N domain-containing protein n=1 Tax=Agrobacterium sp. CNPSo 2736 TaxID=2499627 RepID=UPI000FDAEA89|nr:ORF6N domain-containing protein [Agrobacterium sp. CNPSo 2736]RVT80200.1 hypothetical protein EM858_04180 [Agrobacterium sp. CNPSo 2736]
MIDKVHGRPKDTARKRFNDNLVRFVEGEDYFKVSASEIRTHKILDISPKAHEDFTFVTKRGYLKIAKTLGDDKASICDRRHPERKRYDHVMRDINRLPQIRGSLRRSTVVWARVSWVLKSLLLRTAERPNLSRVL